MGTQSLSPPACEHYKILGIKSPEPKPERVTERKQALPRNQKEKKMETSLFFFLVSATVLIWLFQFNNGKYFVFTNKQM